MSIDAVIVSYNSRPRLRACVEALLANDDVHVVVVDNASSDASLEALRGLPVSAVALPENRGFAAGCNAGWRGGTSPFVLFVNPDASIDPTSLRRLATVLETDERVGIVGPNVVNLDGSLAYARRRFPRLSTTYAQAMFLHRVFPRRPWVDEVVRDERLYARAEDVEWVPGTCLLVRRELLERLDGFDERFFLYCEDMDLCKRAAALGCRVRFQPGAVARHEGGASAPRPSVLPVLAASRVAYARKHERRPAAALYRAGIALGASARVLVARGGLPARAGHARSLIRLTSRSLALR